MGLNAKRNREVVGLVAGSEERRRKKLKSLEMIFVSNTDGNTDVAMQAFVQAYP